MAPLSRPRQSPSDVTKRYSALRKSAPFARAVEYITDSEDDEMEGVGQEDGFLSDFDEGEAQISEQGDEDYMQNLEDDDAGPTTPTPQDAFSASSAKSLLSVQPDITREVQHSSAPPATNVKHAQTDDVLCVCPTRFMKKRTRLGICPECGVIHHYACRARSRAGVSSFLCFDCPNGLLEDVPDPVRGAKSSRKSTSKQHRVKTQPPHKIVKPVPKTKTQKFAGLSQSQKLHAATDNVDSVSNEMLREASPRRHNLRQRAVLNISDRLTRATCKSQSTTGPASTPFDSLYTGLLRKSKQVQKKVHKDPRISDLQKLFLHNIPTKLLWDHYCVMPNGIATNTAVLKATEVHFVDYHVGPVIAAPESWSKELEYRLGLLLDAAASDGQKIHLSPKQWELNAGMALRHVRDIAMEVLHHGSYKGKRAKFGLLGEVLGLSEKGTFWKGGDEFVGNAVSQ